MKPTLLVLAAGMGSRYGGLKQIDGIGPNDEAIIDYSIFDAIRAGFGKVVFVIRTDIADTFKAVIGRRYEGKINVEYAFQELDDLPSGFQVPDGRQKPWGTAHAMLVARSTIREPFAVINADDFYGAEAYQQLADFLNDVPGNPDDIQSYCMVGYELRRTLSDFGAVSRGVSRTDDAGFLTEIVETHRLERDGKDARYPDETGNWSTLPGDTLVSMNIFGFTPSIFPVIESLFCSFLSERGTEQKSEFYIPLVINDLVQSHRATLRVFRTEADWFGVTFREDKPDVETRILELISDGAYPQRLWN